MKLQSRAHLFHRLFFALPLARFRCAKLELVTCSTFARATARCFTFTLPLQLSPSFPSTPPTPPIHPTHTILTIPTIHHHHHTFPQAHAGEQCCMFTLSPQSGQGMEFPTPTLPTSRTSTPHTTHTSNTYDNLYESGFR